MEGVQPGEDPRHHRHAGAQPARRRDVALDPVPESLPPGAGGPRERLRCLLHHGLRPRVGGPLRQRLQRRRTRERVTRL